jgi:hypothetical protein
MCQVSEYSPASQWEGLASSFLAPAHTHTHTTRAAYKYIYQHICMHLIKKNEGIKDELATVRLRCWH